MTIPEIASNSLYIYITGIVHRRKSFVWAINGIGNHIHILVELSSKISLNDMVRDIKQLSSKWMKNQPAFCQFAGWGKDYGAFSCSVTNLDRVKGFILHQKEHHKVKTFEDEYKEIIVMSGLKWNNYYLS